MSVFFFVNRPDGNGLQTRQRMLENCLREMPACDSGSGPSGRRPEGAPGEAPQSGLSEDSGIARKDQP